MAGQSAVQNYQVEIAMFGPHKFGDVIPEYLVRVGGNEPADLVARGVLSRSSRAVNCEVKLPKVVEQADPLADVVEERNKLGQENKELRLNDGLLRAKVEELERAVKARDEALLRQVDVQAKHEATILDLEAAAGRAAERIADLQKQVDDLTDQLTRPAPDVQAAAT